MILVINQLIKKTSDLISLNSKYNYKIAVVNNKTFYINFYYIYKYIYIIINKKNFFLIFRQDLPKSMSFPTGINYKN